MTTDLILTLEMDARGATTPAPLPALPAPLRLITLRSASDAEFTLLDRFYSEMNYPANWAASHLECGAEAVIIVSDQTPIASGLLARREFYIQEIRRSLNPGPAGDYYFGDFVSPQFRGRQLQRHLIRARLELSRRANRQWVTAMTRSTLAASLCNYMQEGFAVAGELRSRTRGKFQLDRIVYPSPHRSAARLSSEGAWLPFGYRLRRR